MLLLSLILLFVITFTDSQNESTCDCSSIATCEDIEEEISELDWDQLFQHEQTAQYHINHSLTINTTELKLLIDLDLEYLRFTYNNHTNSNDMSYVLDLIDNNSDLNATDDMSSHGQCENHYVMQDQHWMNLTGIFYVNIVSPIINFNKDSGYYRVYQILSAPFMIALRKQVSIISTFKIDIITISIIAVYKEDIESDYRLILLTECADFLQLTNPNLTHYPAIDTNIHFQIRNKTINNQCLSNGFMCSQIWEIYANDVPCPINDFSGQYEVAFDTVCNPSNHTASHICDDYIVEYGSNVLLSVDLEWKDEICDATIFKVQFGGEMSLYKDASFHSKLNRNDRYKYGDIAYVEIAIINNPTIAYQLFDVDLMDVWICTTDPEHEPLYTTKQIDTIDGCLSNGIIDDGFPRHIIQYGLNKTSDVMIYRSLDNTSIWFSFLVDSGIERSNLYIHAQIKLSLAKSSSLERRQLLEHSPLITTQTRHFVGTIGVDTNVITIHQNASDINMENADNNKDVECNCFELTTVISDIVNKFDIIIISNMITFMMSCCCFNVMAAICRKIKER